MTPPEIYSPGLESVIAGETAISTLTDGLSYRGYPVVELADKYEFEQVAYLLLHGDLPSSEALDDFQIRLAADSTLPGPVKQWLMAVPIDAVPMDVVRTAVSMLALYDPAAQDNRLDAGLRKAERLLAQIPLIIGGIAARRHGSTFPPRPELGIAGNILWLTTGKEPDAFAKKAFDASLILYAEHEFNASTFTARVVTSTGSDMHSAIVAAIAALKGPLHGGANEKVVDLLAAAGSPGHAEAWLMSALARKEKIMGFGHRVYKTGDVRARVLKDYARQALERVGQSPLEETAEIMEQVMAREKNLYPNLDWPAGRLYYALGLEIPLYTPFFVASRVTGWCAHVLEQQANNRLIRPRSRYVGPPRRGG